MPKKPNYFATGKYGSNSAFIQAGKFYGSLRFYMYNFSNSLDTKILTRRNKLNSNAKRDNNAENDDLKTYIKADAVEKSYKDLTTTRKELKKFLENPPQNVKEPLQKLSGYFKILDKLADTESGDYGRTITENAYLTTLTSAIQNGPQSEDLESLKETLKALDDEDPVTGEKKGPLQALNNYFSLLSDLYDLEYDKQKINADHTPDKEKDYLARLSAKLGEFIENHKTFDSMVDEKTGQSKYDKYLKERSLDIFTRKYVKDGSSKSGRSPMPEIENMKGQKKAIENGWGMNDLEVLGYMYQILFMEKVELKKKQADCTEEEKARREAKYKELIAEKEESLKDDEQKVQKLEKELEELKKKKDADSKEIEKKEGDLDWAKKQVTDGHKTLTMYKTGLANNDKWYEDAQKAIQAQSQKVAGIQALVDEISGKKIKNASDKLDIADKVADFASKGTSDTSSVRNCYKDILKAANKAKEQALAEQEKAIANQEKEKKNNKVKGDNAMPKGPQNLKEGKYGEYNLQFQGFEANKLFMGFVADILTDEESILDSANFANIVAKHKMVQGVQEKDKNGVTFNQITNASPQDEKNFADSCKRIKTKIDNLRESKDPKDAKYKRIDGYLKMLSTVYDTEAGRFTEAVRDNPVIPSMYAMLVNGFKTTRHGGLDNVLDQLSDQTDPVSGKKEPLCYMNDYFSNTADLIHLEYMRQDLKQSHDPAAEKEYVDKLKTCYRKTLDNFDKFCDFVKNNIDEKGETKYDQYMDNPLDMYTGLHHSQVHSQRSANRQMAFIRGELTALENGWGIEEARLAGLVSKEAFHINRTLEVDEKTNAKENLSSNIKNKEEEIAKCNKLLKTEKNADRKALIKNTIKLAEATIKENQEKLDVYDDYHERFRKYSGSLKKLNEDIAKTKNPTAEQKREFLNRYQSIRKNLDKEKYYSKDESEHLKDARQDIIFKGRKIMQDNSVKLTAEDRAGYENYYLVRDLTQHLSTHLKAKDPDLHEDIFHEDDEKHYSKNDKDFGTIRTDQEKIPMNARKRGVLPKTADALEIEFKFSNADSKKMGNWVDKLHKSIENRLSNPAEEDLAFTPYLRVFSTMSDKNKGNFFQIIAEKPYAARLYQSIASGPTLDRGSNAQVRDSLQKNGVLRPVVGLYDGLNDFINAEYYKQGAEKTGKMSKAEEQKYLKLYDDACAKLIKNFDELDKLPDEMQHARIPGLGNSIDNFTARGTDGGGVGRQIRTVVSGLRWQRQAMRNGWGSDNLDLAAVLGNLEGSIEEKTILYEQKLKKEKGNKAPKQEYINDYENKIKALNEFKTEKFESFKESILGKKISNPSDMLDILNKVENFKAQNENHPAVTSNNLFKSNLEAADDIIAKVNNKCINDARALQSGKKTLENIMPRPFKGSVYAPDRSKEFIKNVRNAEGDLSDDFASFMLVGFIEDKILSSTDKAEHPELFDNKHPLYKNSKTELHDQAVKYSEQLAKKLCGDSKKIDTGKLADIMQYGNFDNDLSVIKERMEATKADNKTALFMNGSIQSGTKSESINHALKDTVKKLDKARTFSLFVNEYDSIVTNSERLLKQKLEFDKSLRNQLQAAENSPNGKDVGIDKEKFNKFRHELNVNIARMNKYIAEKDKIRNANPNLPEEQKARLLGQKREAKYQAMKNALESMKALQTVSREFGGAGPTAENYRTLKKPAIVDAASLHNDVALAKSRFEGVIDKANAGIDQIMQKEADARAKLNPAKGDAYKEALFNSAKKTLYLNTVKDFLGSKDTKSIGALETNAKQYTAAIKDYAKNEANSEQFKKFEENYCNHPTFKKHFTDELAKAAKTNKELPLETINSARDKALENCVEQASKNTIELAEISKIAGGLGSKVADTIKAQKAAQANALAKENPQLNIEVKNPVLENKAHRLPTHNMGAKAL